MRPVRRTEGAGAWGIVKWGGEDLRDFVYLSIYTGLRISDVATFDATKRLNGNNVFLRMHETKKPLHSYIPDWLVARLKQAFALAGPWGEDRPSPHRFSTYLRPDIT